MSHILLKIVQIKNIFELNLYLILLNSIKDYYVAMEHIENLYAYNCPFGNAFLPSSAPVPAPTGL